MAVSTTLAPSSRCAGGGTGATVEGGVTALRYTLRRWLALWLHRLGSWCDATAERLMDVGP